MDLKIYENTRYQNIYRHKKNGNYVVRLSNPSTTISRIDGKKILDVKIALKVRDSSDIKQQKKAEALYRESFDTLWDKYITHCKIIDKLAYNTILRKVRLYNRYFKGKIEKPISKTDTSFWAKYINSLECSDKQKNEMLKILKAFFNWCVNNDYLFSNPVSKLKNFKVIKSEMKYWTPDEIKTILDYLNNAISCENSHQKAMAYRTKIMILIGFSLGDRIGETRALTFDCFSDDLNRVSIKHSINYDRSSKDYLSSTKNYHSQRDIDITDKLIEEVKCYRHFLENEMGYDVKDNTLIFYNFKEDHPMSDTALRKQFYKYCELAGVKKIRMYDLRHTYVATMMGDGLELYHISSRLGHSNYNTTVNKYGHLSNEVKKQVAKITDKYI